MLVHFRTFWTRNLGQGGPHGQAVIVGRVVGADSTFIASRTAEAERWSAAGLGSRMSHGDPLHSQKRLSLGVSPLGDGLRLRHDLLAASPRLGGSRSLGKNLEGLSQRTRGCRRSRLVLGGHRQLLGSRTFWGEKTGPNPTDRGKNGSKRHLITDADGVPLAIEHSGANVHDSRYAVALVDAIPPIKQPDGRRRRRPDEVLADRAYDADDKIRKPLKRRRIIPTIGHRNEEHGSGLGAFRYVVEACFEWLFQWRRLRVRYEKRDDIHQAFLNLGCALICWRRLEVFC
jgi:transposase